MGKKIAMIIIFCVLCSYGVEFTFSNDTISEEGLYNYSQFPLNTHLINLSEDSLYIDSLALIIDTITFPEYEIGWWATMDDWIDILYGFGNRELGYPPIASYSNNDILHLMRENSKDSIELKEFTIDKMLPPFCTTQNTRKEPIYDSIVPITVNIVFFSEGYTDTLTLNGLYNYDFTTSIIEKKLKVNLIKQNESQSDFLFDCLGRKIDIRNILQKNKNIANGIFTSPNKKRIIILHNSTDY